MRRWTLLADLELRAKCPRKTFSRYQARPRTPYRGFGMDRRNFLQCLGAFAASAFLPSCSESIVRAPKWWTGRVMVYRTSAPLAAGNYTFTAYAGEMGLYIGGVKASGGERLFEIPWTDKHPFDNPRINRSGINVTSSMDFCDPKTRDAMLRGDSVTLV